MTNLRSLLVAAIFVYTPFSLQAAEVGSALPVCNLKNFADEAVLQLAQPGKVLYVDFWASWCPPCAQSIPFLNEVQAQYKDKGLEVIGINLDENKTDADAFLKTHPIKFTIASNPDTQCPEVFGVQAMPSSYLIDRTGKIRHIQLGFHSAETDEIRQKVQKLLAEK